jgi:carbonyl reductase 1
MDVAATRIGPGDCHFYPVSQWDNWSMTVALVTGANQGLGLALVRGLTRSLGEEGVVYLAARNEQRGQHAVEELERDGLRASLLILDVADTEQVAAAAELLRERHGGVDIVLSNAAARRTPDRADAESVAEFINTNNHGTYRMIQAFWPLMRDNGRFIVVASAFGTLRYLPEQLHEKFDTDTESLEENEAVLDEYAALVQSGKAAAEGWPSSINIASKIGQVAAVRILARTHRDEARARGILINAACPGLIDTDASRPWFQDMSQAQSPDDAAADVLWLAILPAGTAEPYGELVQHQIILPFRGTPLTVRNRTDALPAPQPRRHFMLVLGRGSVERGAAVPRRLPVTVGTVCQQVLGTGQLPGPAGVPERHRDSVTIACFDQRAQLVRQAEGGHVRQPDLGTTFPQTPHSSPLRIAERRPDRRAAANGGAWMLDVGASIKQRVDELDVVVAGCPVQCGLVMPCTPHMGIQIGAGCHQSGHHRGGIRPVTRSVGEMLQGRAPVDPGIGQLWVGGEELSEPVNVALLDSAQKISRHLLARFEPARRLVRGRILS